MPTLPMNHPNIIEINGDPYFVGMQWDAYPSIPSKNDIREEADVKEAISYVLRQGANAVQVGFSDTSTDEIPKRTASLAAHLADSAREPWLGIFELGQDRWWYIAVRDHNAILPDGDVIGTEAEVTAARDAHSGFTDWQYIQGDIKDLAALVQEIKVKPARLKSVRPTPRERNRALTVAGVVAASLVISSAGLWFYLEQQEEENIRLRQAQEQSIRSGKIEAAKAAFVSAFYTTPPPGKVITACRQVFADTPLSLHGWLADQITCTPTSAVVTWSRGEGASVRTTPPGTIADDGERVTQSIPFQLVADPDTTSSADLANLEDLKRALLAWAQEGGFTFTSAPVPAPQIPEGVDPSELPPPVPALSFTVTTKISPLAMQADFEAYPGLRITALRETSNSWTIEGVLYGTR